MCIRDRKQCNKCEEYLEKVKEQIKNKEVKSSVAEEIEQHILDQKYVYIAEGAEEEEAERRAVADIDVYKRQQNIQII